MIQANIPVTALLEFQKSSEKEEKHSHVKILTITSQCVTALKSNMSNYEGSI